MGKKLLLTVIPLTLILANCSQPEASPSSAPSDAPKLTPTPAPTATPAPTQCLRSRVPQHQHSQRQTTLFRETCFA